MEGAKIKARKTFQKVEKARKIMERKKTEKIEAHRRHNMKDRIEKNGGILLSKKYTPKFRTDGLAFPDFEKPTEQFNT